MLKAHPLAAALLAASLAPAEGAEELQGRVERLSREADRIAAELTADAREASEIERELTTLTGQLAQLAAEEAAAWDALEAKRGRLRQLLAALAALSRAPAPAILAHPDAPLAAARAATLMERIGPALIEEARGAEAAVRDIAELRANGEMAREKLRASAAELAALRADLETELAARREDLTAAEDKAGAALEAEALARAVTAAEAFESALHQAAPDPDATPTFGDIRGALTPPLNEYRRLARFGSAPKGSRSGAPKTGLWLQGSAHRAVLAPWSGEILFAGPFRKLRNVIILEPETGYLIVLGGLAGLSRGVGDEVNAGDVIGRLDGPMTPNEEFLVELTAIAGDEQQIDPKSDTGPDAAGVMLYMEVRENGKPTDPDPWLRSEEKVSSL